MAPNAGETHLALANYHYRLNDDEPAETELAQARRSLPNDPQVLLLTGLTSRRQGQWDPAVRNMEQALGRDPHSFLIIQQPVATYEYLARYDDTQHLIQRALAAKPGDPLLRLYFVDTPIYSNADMGPYRRTVPGLVAENPELAFQLDDPEDTQCERDPAAYARTLSHISPGGYVDFDGLILPRGYWEGLFARFEGDAARAQAAFAAAREELARAVIDQPGEAMRLSFLGVIDAGLGHKADAIVEGQRACALLPISKDAVLGPDVLTNLAQIYAWTREKQAALAKKRAASQR